MAGTITLASDVQGINFATGNPQINRGQPIAVTVFPTGELRSKEESTQLMVDTFDNSTGFDTTNNWSTPVTGNSGVAAALVTGGGAISLASGTANSGYSYLTSRANFNPLNPGFNEFQANINLTYPYSTTTRVFWGIANGPAAPTTVGTNFLTEAFGFELQEGSGKMYAVTYQGGTRIVIQDLSSSGNATQPNDASVHRYGLIYKGDTAFWTIDGRDNIVASMTNGVNGPNTNSLPVRFQAVNTAAGTTSAVLQVNAFSMSDTARNAMAMADGNYGWRKQTVYPSGSSYSGQVTSEGQRATYRYAVTGFTPVATPTAFVVIQGSATKVIRIKRIYVSGVATAAGNMPLVGTRRSTAGTLGSAVLTAVTASKHDTNDAAPTAVISTVGTANYTTLGTTAGQMLANRIGLSAAGSGVADSPAVYDFSTRNDKPIILRGTLDYLTLEGNGAAVPAGGALDIEIETEEDTY